MNDDISTEATHFSGYAIHTAADDREAERIDRERAYQRRRAWEKVSGLADELDTFLSPARKADLAAPAFQKAKQDLLGWVLLRGQRVVDALKADADRQKELADNPATGAVDISMLTEDLAEILGTPCFSVIEEARLFRSLGYEIPSRAEQEQAFFIHRWLGFYAAHGPAWRDVARADVLEHVDKARAKLRADGASAQGDIRTSN